MYKLQHRRLISFFILIFLILIIPITIFAVKQNQDIRQKAAENNISIIDTINSTNEPIYIKGQVLVKLKTSPSAQHQEGNPFQVYASETETPDINIVVDKLKEKYTIKSIEEVIKKPRAAKFSALSTQGEIDKDKQVYKVSFNQETPIEEVITDLEKDPQVAYSQPNYLFSSLQAPDDQLYPIMWNLKKIQIEQAWQINTGSRGITVAVLDTGIDYPHEDLQPLTKGPDFGNGDADSSPDYEYEQLYPGEVMHGTHVSGTINALTGNHLGVAGINKNVNLLFIKVFKYFPEYQRIAAPTEAIISGIDYAINNNAKIINLSLGGPPGCTANPIYQDIINQAYSQGVTVIAAAANSNQDAVNFSPASCQHVIAVGATGLDDERASFSNFGSTVAISAPGGNYINPIFPNTTTNPKCLNPETLKTDCWIWSTAPHNKYLPLLGTSMASPHVAGVAALLLSQKPDLTPDQIKQILVDSGDTITTDKPIGKRLNAYKALLAITPPTPTSTPTTTQTPTPSPSPSPTPTATPISPSSTPTNTPLPSGSVLPGDINGDGSINITDYNQWRTLFINKDYNSNADFNNNSNIDIGDFNIWRNNATP